MAESKQTLVRAAQQAIAQHAASTSAPLVVWAFLGEPEEKFDKRVRGLRTNWNGPVLAAVPYGYKTPDGVRRVEFPPKQFELLHPSVAIRYRRAAGGRGSAKSHSFARAVILAVLARRMRVLCCREIMRSLRESVHHLLVDTIDALGVTQWFDVNDREIRCIPTGGEILFAGLWANINTLKSLENISLVWIEEAESASARSLEVLTPTIRAAGSEIWLSDNPDDAQAPSQGFTPEQRPDVRFVHVTYEDNPWFGDTPLEAERAYLQRVDDDAYRHVWLGECRVISDAQIFRGKYVTEEFTPGEGWGGPYHGLDLGFSADPSVLTKCWLFENKLYVEREAWGLHIDTDRLPQLIDEVPDARNHTIRVDSSRPETVSYLKQHGCPNVESVEKWPDSVKDGIARMRAFEKIVLHPRCEHTAQEFRLYSYKTDRLTNDVLPEVKSGNDHCIDSIRYAIGPLIKTGGFTAFMQYMQTRIAKEAAEKTKAADGQPIEKKPTPLWQRPGVISRDI